MSILGILSVINVFWFKIVKKVEMATIIGVMKPHMISIIYFHSNMDTFVQNLTVSSNCYVFVDDYGNVIHTKDEILCVWY